MATTIAQLLATLGLDSADFNKGIDQAEQKGSGLGKALGGLSTIGGGVLAAGFATATAGAIILGKELTTDVRAAMESQQVTAQLEAVLKSTGGAAGVTAEEVENLSNALSMKTGIDDDAITSAQSMLLTFTDIGSEVFPEATQAILDMASGMNGGAIPSAEELRNQSIQLGKALQDPDAGLGALSRVGVNVDDLKKKFTPLMSKEEKQILILQELATEFGGSAEAAGSTFTGQLAKLQVSLGNIRESVGEKLIPSLTRLAEMFSDYIARPEVQEFIQELADGIATFASNVIDNLPKVIQWFGNLFMWFMNNKPIIVGILAALGVAVVAFAVTTIAAIAPIIAAMLPIIAIMILIGAYAYFVYRAWTENWGGIQTRTKAFFDWLKKAWDAIWSILGPVLEYVFAQIKTLWQAFSALFQGDFYTFGVKIREYWDRAWNAIKAIGSTAWAFLKTQFANLIVNIINTFRNADWTQIGRNIMQGIANGINAGVSFIRDAAIRAADAAMQALWGFLGIHSPAMLPKMTVGLPMGEGVAVGFGMGLDKFMEPAYAKLMPSSLPTGTGGISGDATVIRLLEELVNKEPVDIPQFARSLRDIILQETK